MPGNSRPTASPEAGARMQPTRTTRLLQTGRPPAGQGPRPVNPPVMRASTVVFDSVAEWRAARQQRQTRQVLSYGARGTQTTFALENALSELEKGHRTQLYPTGLAAATQVLMALLRPGEHLLITDAVYAPVRHFCSTWLPALGVDCEFYAADGHDVAARLRPGKTRMIYAEVPGSLLNDMLDLPALAALARSCGAWLAVDNTWASGWLLNPLTLGADISILAATKYIAGHSDLLLGAAVCNERAYPVLAHFSESTGQTVSPDDAALALRGLRTLELRLERHERNALAVAQWLGRQPAVARVFHPALPDDPGHALWKRDFKGGNGLLAVEFHDPDPGRRDRFVDALECFGIGASWGGFESLAVPIDPAALRSVGAWHGRGSFVRLHVGLESPEDLCQDLMQAIVAAQFTTAPPQPDPDRS
ncbi:cystathionine beta-lyase, partial [Verminephrobacter aporrectodeae subsp. tuberculatae]|nr:cystathionine beta-lyase [Verminephrobacter aporrectodeae subsp. tuberculatae]